MYGKLLIKTDLKVLTGMHIGGSNAFSAIGAVDSPVVTDPRTEYPILPGSSLKGKLRTLLVRSRVNDITKMPRPNEDDKDILRLFGSSSKPIEKSRLMFADAFVCNLSEFPNGKLTEIKFENTIDRETCVATPRQIERVISGVKFGVAIAYDIISEIELFDDMKLLAKGMRLLQLDYLGGHGTRGSGRVSFENIRVEQKECDIGADKLDSLNALFREVEAYELLSV